MTPERWSRVAEIYDSTLEQPPAGRAGFLATACGDDTELRREVESLLAQEQTPVVVDRPVGAAAASVLGSVPQLTPGTVIGPYRVVGMLGEGGMGQVYRAHDTKLQRDVALKILPDAFVHAGDRVARFTREAQVLAALNHPNIGAIYGFEDSGDVHALVLELVEGPTLADRIARGHIPVDEALPIARQITEALEAAHEHGIVHRDLKPANIKVREDGTVKVLDFGLAKLTTGDSASGAARDLTNSPTLLSPAVTTGGVLLGTAAYMSPEQAKGKPTDTRSDVWAFGCVLYEMITGRRAFEGEDVSETLAAVLRGEPDWSLLERRDAGHLRDAIRGCLIKDPRKRIPHIAVVRFLVEREAPAPVSVQRAGGRAPWLIAVAAIAALVGGMATIWFTWPASAVSPRAWRFELPLAEPLHYLPVTAGANPDVAVSPDGASVVYVTAPAGLGAGQGEDKIVLRRLDRLEATVLVSSNRLVAPTFSPDGRWIAFNWGQGDLRKVRVDGGPTMPIASIGLPLGVSWGDDDNIVYAVVGQPGLFRVSANGGEPERLTTPNTAGGELLHFLPAVLPGAGAVLYTVMVSGPSPADPAASAIAALDLRTRRSKVVARGGSHPQFVEPGFLVYHANGALMAVRFDRDRLEVEGEPVTMVPAVLTKSSPRGVLTTEVGTAEYSVSRDGTLVYSPFAEDLRTTSAADRALMWVTRSGVEEPIPGASRGAYTYPRVSPDGTRVVVTRRDAERPDIWLLDLARQTLSRLTNDAAAESASVWIDAQTVAFGSPREGFSHVYVQRVDTTGTAKAITTETGNKTPTGVSRTGQIVYWQVTRSGDLDLMTVDIAQPHRIQPLLATPASERNADVSPDGAWVAYDSTESGTYQVYARPFNTRGEARLQISTSGGKQPRWSPSGRELFYFNDRGELMAAPVQASSGVLKIGTPSKLLDAKYFAGGPGANARTFDVAPDGRFLMIKGPVESTDRTLPDRLVVVGNWREELKTRLASN